MSRLQEGEDNPRARAPCSHERDNQHPPSWKHGNSAPRLSKLNLQFLDVDLLCPGQQDLSNLGLEPF
jgi:hypothetical protein